MLNKKSAHESNNGDGPSPSDPEYVIVLVELSEIGARLKTEGPTQIEIRKQNSAQRMLPLSIWMP